MSDFRAHRLHSGRSGKIVTNKRQAKAILLSYLEKEHRIGKCTKKKHGKCVSRKKAKKRVTK